MTQQAKPGMARWLKVTIAVVALGGISGIVLLVAGGLYVFESTRKTMDPKYTAKIAKTIVQIDEPLPAGFTRVMAFDVMGVGQVAYTNTSQGLTLNIMKMQKDNRRLTAQFVVDEFVKTGVPDGGTTGDGGKPDMFPLTIQARGNMQVGGEEMLYAIGERSMSGAKMSQMVGCIMPVADSRRILIIGQTNRFTDRKFDLVKKFLAAVKGF